MYLHVTEESRYRGSLCPCPFECRSTNRRRLHARRRAQLLKVPLVKSESYEVHVGSLPDRGDDVFEDCAFDFIVRDADALHGDRHTCDEIITPAVDGCALLYASAVG